MLKKIIGIYLILVAVLVGVHTVVEPLYHVSTEAQPYSAAWNTLNPLMIVALVLGIAYSYLRKSGVDKEENTSTRQYIVANTLFYGFLFVRHPVLLELVQPSQPGVHRDRRRDGLLGVDRHRRPAPAADRSDGRATWCAARTNKPRSPAMRRLARNRSPRTPRSSAPPRQAAIRPGIAYRAIPGGLRREPRGYSTVTVLARLRGWSRSVPLNTAT